MHCNGNAIVLDFATPIPGASVMVANPGPEEIEVSFKKDGRESGIHARCQAGVPREDPHSDE